MGADVHSIRFLRGGHRQRPESRRIGGRLLPALLVLAVVAVLVAIGAIMVSKRRDISIAGGDDTGGTPTVEQPPATVSATAD